MRLLLDKVQSASAHGLIMQETMAIESVGKAGCPSRGWIALWWISQKDCDPQIRATVWSPAMRIEKREYHKDNKTAIG